jgi:Zn/Cd-binding protein ZinT
MFDSIFDKDDLSTTTMTHFSGDWQDIYRYQLALEE